MADVDGKKVVATNRKARHDYEILETMEAGIVLKGPEVKSLRAGKVGFQDAFARVMRGETAELGGRHFVLAEEFLDGSDQHRGLPNRLVRQANRSPCS